MCDWGQDLECHRVQGSNFQGFELWEIEVLCLHGKEGGKDVEDELIREGELGDEECVEKIVWANISELKRVREDGRVFVFYGVQGVSRNWSRHPVGTCRCRIWICNNGTRIDFRMDFDVRKTKGSSEIFTGFHEGNNIT